MIHQSLVERLRDLRQEGKTIALGEQQQQFDDDRLERTGPGDQLFHDPALAQGGNRRVRQRTQQRFAAGDEPREVAQVPLRLQQILPLGQRDIEQGASVPDGGASTRHRASLPPRKWRWPVAAPLARTGTPTSASSTRDRDPHAVRGRMSSTGCWIVIDKNIRKRVWRAREGQEARRQRIRAFSVVAPCRTALNLVETDTKTWISPTKQSINLYHSKGLTAKAGAENRAGALNPSAPGSDPSPRLAKKSRTLAISAGEQLMSSLTSMSRFRKSIVQIRPTARRSDPVPIQHVDPGSVSRSGAFQVPIVQRIGVQRGLGVRRAPRTVDDHAVCVDELVHVSPEVGRQHVRQRTVTRAPVDGSTRPIRVAGTPAACRALAAWPA